MKTPSKGPPRTPYDAANTFVIREHGRNIRLVTAADLRAISDESGLPIALSQASLLEVADSIADAFEGYIAAKRRDDGQPTNTTRRDWGRRLAGAARDLMIALDIDSAAEDPIANSWTVADAVTMLLHEEPEQTAEIAPVASRLDATLRAAAGPATPEVALATPEDFGAIVQRAMFTLAPALALLAQVGASVERHHGARVTRGGSASDAARRWLFSELAAAFERLHGRLPAGPKAGRARGRINADLAWFRALLVVVLGRALTLGDAGDDLVHLSNDALDTMKRTPTLERLSDWVNEATANAAEGGQSG